MISALMEKNIHDSDEKFGRKRRFHAGFSAGYQVKRIRNVWSPL